jgi:hypothetical protein
VNNDRGFAIHESQRAWKAFRIAHEEVRYRNVLAADHERLLAFNEQLTRLEERLSP